MANGLNGLRSAAIGILVVLWGVFLLTGTVGGVLVAGYGIRFNDWQEILSGTAAAAIGGFVLGLTIEALRRG